MGPARATDSTTPSPVEPSSIGRTDDRLRPDRRSVADRLPEEAGDVRVRRARPDVVRRADLHDPAVAQDRHAVTERERLGLVVRDVERGHAELREERLEVVEKSVAESAVERSERLVEQEDARLGGERAGEGDALLFASRERRHGAVLESGEPDEVQRLPDACRDLLRRVAAHAQAERDVATHVEVVEQGVVLEHHPDPAPVRRNGREVVSVEEHAAAIRLLQPGDDAQERALARPARPEHSDDLALGHVERHAVEREPLPEADGDVLDRAASEPAESPAAEPLDREDRDRRDDHEDHGERVRLRDVQLAGPAEEAEDRDRQGGSVGTREEDGRSELPERDREGEAGCDRERASRDAEVDLPAHTGRRRSEQSGCLALAHVDRAQRRDDDANDERDRDERLYHRHDPRRGAEVERRLRRRRSRTRTRASRPRRRVGA